MDSKSVLRFRIEQWEVGYFWEHTNTQRFCVSVRKFTILRDVCVSVRKFSKFAMETNFLLSNLLPCCFKTSPCPICNFYSSNNFYPSHPKRASKRPPEAAYLRVFVRRCYVESFTAPVDAIHKVNIAFYFQ